jgi:RNA polymerase sigma factor (sigma-70 family)
MWQANVMDKENAKVRNKLKNIYAIKELEELLDMVVLSEEERRIVIMHYKEEKPLSYIADDLGMSEVNVKKKHRKILMKIGRIFK